MKRGKMKWALPAGLIVIFSAIPHKAEARHEDSAKKLYEAGQLAEARDDVITACEDYAQAFKNDPKDLRYKTAWERTRFGAAAVHVSRGEKLRQQGDNVGALTELVRGLDFDPSNEVAREDIQEIKKNLSIPVPDREISTSPDEQSEVADMSAPVMLKPVSNEPLSVIGGKWKALIICELMIRKLRYNELEKSLGYISRRILTYELRFLERKGIVQRSSSDTSARRMEYSLTNRGRALNDVLVELASWGRRADTL